MGRGGEDGYDDQLSLFGEDRLKDKELELSVWQMQATAQAPG